MGIHLVVKGGKIKSEITALVDLFKDEKYSQKLSSIASLLPMLIQLHSDISSDIHYPYEILQLLIEVQDVLKNENDSTKLWSALRHRCIDGILHHLQENEEYIQKQKGTIAYNSDDYYTEQLEKMRQEKMSLIEHINELKEKTSEKEAESQMFKSELEQREAELNKYVNLIEKYEREKQEQEKIKDAIDEWEKKIKKAFEALKCYIMPITKEHDRLCLLYKGYLGLSVIFILGLLSIEIIVCYKIASHIGLPTWQEYFSLILPIPISMVLLWGFIHEMNRAQRQLVILAKQIHEIEYVEGLLLTINKLSTNMNDSMNRVNSAIDKLVENHLISLLSH